MAEGRTNKGGRWAGLQASGRVAKPSPFGPKKEHARCYPVFGLRGSLSLRPPPHHEHVSTLTLDMRPHSEHGRLGAVADEREISNQARWSLLRLFSLCLAATQLDSQMLQDSLHLFLSPNHRPTIVDLRKFIAGVRSLRFQSLDASFVHL